MNDLFSWTAYQSAYQQNLYKIWCLDLKRYFQNFITWMIYFFVEADEERFLRSSMSWPSSHVWRNSSSIPPPMWHLVYLLYLEKTYSMFCDAIQDRRNWGWQGVITTHPNFGPITIKTFSFKWPSITYFVVSYCPPNFLTFRRPYNIERMKIRRIGK